ncbi:MAG: hypothetical protein NVV67_15960 [Pseudoxanthomonas sp.]|nr:hypothetical protein [Pseudoxanthomonas sp.]
MSGMVFTTGEDDAFTIWTLVDWDPVHHYARYARTTPALRATTVEIRCQSLGASRSQVEVIYTLTALSPDGSKLIKEWEAGSFMTMIDGWAEAIAIRLPQLQAASAR